MASTEITVRYYNVFITKNEELTNINFFEFLDYVYLKDPSIKQKGEYCFKKMKLPKEMNHNNSSDRAISIASYRVRKPKKGNKATEDYAEIDFDVFEDTNCLYQHTEKLFICEYNHHGAKIKEIKEYFQNFLPKSENSDDPIWGIEFIELHPKNSLKDVLEAKEIKSLDIKLDLTSSQVNYFKTSIPSKKQAVTQEVIKIKKKKEQNEEEIHKLMDDTLKNMIRTKKFFGGGVFNFSISKGQNWRNNSLDTEAIKTFLKYLDVDSSLFSKIMVSYISKDGTTVDNLDLKHSKVLYKKIKVDGDSWDIITKEIEKFYYEKSNRLGKGKWKNHEVKCKIETKDYPFSLD